MPVDAINRVAGYSNNYVTNINAPSGEGRRVMIDKSFLFCTAELWPTLLLGRPSLFWFDIRFNDTRNFIRYPPGFISFYLILAVRRACGAPLCLVIGRMGGKTGKTIVHTVICDNREFPVMKPCSSSHDCVSWKVFTCLMAHLHRGWKMFKQCYNKSFAKNNVEDSAHWKLLTKVETLFQHCLAEPTEIGFLDSLLCWVEKKKLRWRNVVNKMFLTAV